MATAAPKWVPRQRDFTEESKVGLLKGDEVTVHPLLVKEKEEPQVTKSVTTTTPAAKKAPIASDPLQSDPLGSAQVADPLSASDPLSGPSDPLSAPKAPTPVVDATSVNRREPLNTRSASTLEDRPSLSWASKKSGILMTYVTDELVGIQVSFVKEGLDQAKAKTASAEQRTQQRLAQLEQSEEDLAKETLQMTQKDYEKHIEKLHEDLQKAWKLEDRVKSLKIAIQCAKMLTDISVIKFYPSKFVLVTEILDTFGNLVYERIAKRTDNIKEKFLPTEISDQARETCRNWFYKIASIRELLPRLYVEMAILRCYEFIQHNTFPIVISRIGKMIRGIGDPLIAMYARTYLARRGYEVAPMMREYLLESFEDFIWSQKYLKTDRFQASLKNYHVSLPEYYGLYSPALEWQLQCISLGANQQTFERVMDKYKESGDPYTLKYIISTFPPNVICQNAKSITGLIREAADVLPKSQLYIALGTNLVQSHPPKDQALPILNDVWKVVTKIEDPAEYMSVATVYIEYPLNFCGTKEVNILLGDILRHIKQDAVYESLQFQLELVIQKVVNHYGNFADIFGMENFLPLLDLVIGETQISVNKNILQAFAKSADGTSDPTIINTMFVIGKTVHDSLNSLSFQDDIRQVSKALASFIYKIDFGMELEKHLNFFVECRRAFTNFDLVKHHLVFGACRLAMKTLQIVKGKHSNKTSAFIRACIAFCFITIPSMDDVFSRLNLYLLTAQVALQNKALTQADTLIKASIRLIQEVPAKIEIDSQKVSSEEALVSFLNNLMSLLVVAPAPPDGNPFILVKALAKVITEFPWERPWTKTRIYMNLIVLLSTGAQSKLPYHIAGVDSNDAMYVGDPNYSAELQAIINKLMDEILDDIQKIVPPDAASPSEDDLKIRSKLALDLFNYLTSFSEMNPRSAKLAMTLYSLCGSSDASGYLSQSLQALQHREGHIPRELYKRLSTQ